MKKSAEESYSKMIFLSVDGVINSDEHAEHIRKEYKRLGNSWTKDKSMVDENKLNMLAELCENNPGLYICLTSSWREFTYYKTLDRMEQYNEWKRIIPFIKGVTPISSYNPKTYNLLGDRGEEINKWLSKKERSVDKYCILDCSDDFTDEQKQFLIKVDQKTGITINDISKLKELLHLNG